MCIYEAVCVWGEGGCTQARPSPFDPGFPHLWYKEATAPTYLPQGSIRGSRYTCGQALPHCREGLTSGGHPLLVLFPDEAGAGQMEATVTDG